MLVDDKQAREKMARQVLREAFAWGLNLRHKKGCPPPASNFEMNKPCKCGRDALHSKLNELAFAAEERPDGICGPLEDGYCQVCGVYECLTHPTREDLLATVESLSAQVAELQRTFQHYYHDGAEVCRQCGLPRNNLIHVAAKESGDA